MHSSQNKKVAGARINSAADDMCVRACVPACVLACVLACVRACVLACVRTCVRACECMYVKKILIKFNLDASFRRYMG